MSLLWIPIVFLCDQWSKCFARNQMNDPEVKEQLNKCFKQKLKFGLVYNEGAAMGLMANRPALLKGFTLLAIAVLSVIWVVSYKTKGPRGIRFGISLMLGGALGNLYDRYRFGKVTDFFAFWFRPNLYFNVADLFVFLGALWISIKKLF